MLYLPMCKWTLYEGFDVTLSKQVDWLELVVTHMPYVWVKG